MKGRTIDLVREVLRRFLGNPVGWIVFQFTEVAVLLGLAGLVPDDVPGWTGWLAFPLAIGVTIWANLRLLDALGLRTRSGDRRGGPGA